MFYEFYIDQFAAEHLLSGYLLLLAASKAAGRKISYRRLLAGSTVSVMIMILLICRGVRGWYFMGMFMAGLTVFGVQNLKKTAEYQGILLLSTLCFGGVLKAVVQIFGLPMTAAVTAAGFVLYQCAAVRKKKEYAEVQCRVSLKWQEQYCTVQALLDTGNSLREPLTGRPVSVLAKAEAEKLLGNGWEQRKGFYMIPYHTLGAEKNWMQAVTADRMQIEYEGRTIVTESPVIALYQGKLGKNCQMILHCEHVRSDVR